MTQIVLSHVEKVYAGGVKALDDLNLEVTGGESPGLRCCSAWSRT